MTKEQLIASLTEYFKTRRPASKTKEPYVSMICELMRIMHADGKTLKQVSEAVGCESRHLYHYPKMAGVEFKTNYLKDCRKHRKTKLPKENKIRLVKTVSELIEEDITENRFFSIRVMGANPTALERISYKTEACKYSYMN
ncbi:hypothetical protein [Thiomicrorhabdus sp.]|uniref:hypothetical protein n=1 Tax=Thiomicrorhabdus sp. TaxID=2039724 RepID=UPI0029C97D09|nr:hypothetical protein [Thiomicrorhabdus sp.]